MSDSATHSPEERLSAHGWTLPPAAAPGGQYRPVVRFGNVAMTAGQLPRIGEEMKHTGTVGIDTTIVDAQHGAELSVLNALAALRAELGTLSAVTSVLHLRGFVRAVSDFELHARVLDAGSAVLLTAFGDDGRHARTAIGAASLPRGSVVEVELTVMTVSTVETANG